MKFKIPVTVIVLGEVTVEASNFEIAKDKALVAGSDEWRDMELNEVSIPPGTCQDQCIQDAKRE